MLFFFDGGVNSVILVGTVLLDVHMLDVYIYSVKITTSKKFFIFALDILGLNLRESHKEPWIYNLR